MNKKEKQAAGFLFLAVAIIASVFYVKKRKNKRTDDYDWIMW